MNHRCAKYPFQKACWLFTILLLASPWPADAASKKEFRFANLPNTYMGGHIKESRLAMQMILKKAFNQKHPELKLKLDFLPDNDRLLQTIRTTGYDVLTMTGFDYLELKDEIGLTPLAIMSRCEQPTESFLLITRPDRNWKSIMGKPRRILLIEDSTGDAIPKTWLNEILIEQGLPGYGEVFTTVRSVDKPSRAILPVFFGQADMGIVSRTALDLMAELNPQIKDRLVILRQSPGFVNLLVCGTDRLAEWAKEIIIEEATSMHTYPVGQQALTIIQMNRFIRFQPEHLKATETLFYNGRHPRRWERQGGHQGKE
jgi:ABC-type phosphate/phosphonate transport system substrate-binding protein